jgi:hypothetical protein
MLTCEALMDLLMEQDVEDLPDAEQDDARGHLDACGGCAAFVRSLHAVTPMVKDAMELTVDDALQAELDAAVMAALRREA